MNKNYEGIKILGNCYIEESVVLGKNITIYPNVYIIGESKIDDNVTLYPNTTIENTKIGEGTIIKSSYLENSIVGKNCQIGPFTHLRPNCVIGDECHLGNFVEVKNSSIGNKTKANHLAYIGDADVGSNCNIGCGAIFVNYNGRTKNRTIVGDECFIGSNCNVIAPVNVANRTYLCAGTTLTQDTNTEDFIIGRARETIKPNRANNYLKPTNLS